MAVLRRITVSAALLSFSLSPHPSRFQVADFDLHPEGSPCESPVYALLLLRLIKTRVPTAPRRNGNYRKVLLRLDSTPAGADSFAISRGVIYAALSTAFSPGIDMRTGDILIHSRQRILLSQLALFIDVFSRRPERISERNIPRPPADYICSASQTVRRSRRPPLLLCRWT